MPVFITDILFPVYCVLINLAAFAAMGADKYFAKAGMRRIPEAALLLLCFAGGGIGGLIGMYLFHHKTRKKKFTVLVPLSILIFYPLVLFGQEEMPFDLRNIFPQICL